MQIQREDKDLSIFILEKGDLFSVGGAEENYYGSHETSTILYARGHLENGEVKDIEILLPKRAWDQLIDNLTPGKTGTVFKI